MTLHLERIAPPSRLLKSHLGRDEIPWRTNRSMLQDCLACRRRVSIVIGNLDYFHYLPAPIIVVGYPPMMKFAANLPTHSMHITRPQS